MPSPLPPSNRLTQRLRALSGLMRRLAQVQLDDFPRAVLDTLADPAVFGLRNGSIAVLDAEPGMLRVVAQHGYPEGSIPHALALGEGVTGRAALEGRLIYVPDVQRAPEYVPGALGVGSEAALPFKVRRGDEEVMLGVLDVERAERAAFDEDDLALLELFVEQVAMYYSLMDAVQSDALTGARSVAALTPLLRALVHEYRETRRPGMVVFADLNNLHELNLRFGHEVGNLALQHFVTVIRATVRGNDPVVRFGGDEFVIVLRETEDPAVVPRIMAALAQPVPMESLPPQHRPEQPVVITGSFGIVPLAAFFEHHPELAKEADLGYCLALLRAEASQVMLRAKHASRGAGGLSIRSEAARLDA